MINYYAYTDFFKQPEMKICFQRGSVENLKLIDFWTLDPQKGMESNRKFLICYLNCTYF